MTGANQGIGAAIAIAFAREGAWVLITFLGQSSELYGGIQTKVENTTTPVRSYYRRKIGQSSDLVAEEIRTFGDECIMFEADLSDPGMIPKLFNMAEVKWGKVDILVNNAAFADLDTFLPQSVLDRVPIFFGALFSFFLSFLFIGNILFWKYLEEIELKKRFNTYLDYKKTTLF